ncbi:MAG: hypothetical protein A2722_00785 [Candidatus Doudnabacteria bacterium RIFCSPHIGHO2_01_FULL_50_11]|uniref:Hydroxyacid dehydrogenase n=1 Tax=Candidatus Doudnabacteria bacterium RIFCSPHIGHO2_01_FULL_50_11 TaxID=1817828 RepID=A0A1F5PG54_9BACT|nr:MAG: hypothetical protein A2722_00785 [Candidatus Doudnabacteria bacterium RIFCSPHIGHO2_01_FULL_50_11]
MTISFLEVSEGWQKKLIQEAFQNSQYKLIISPNKLTAANVAKYSDSDALSVFIHSEITDGVLQKLPQLKIIVTNSTGYDHIDLSACKRRGVLVANVPFYGENTVAEHTFALILALSRKIVDSVNRTRRGQFDLTGLRGFDLKNKTIGVVGTGHIGRHVIRIAHGFEMKILAYDLFPDKSLESHYPLKYVSLNQLLPHSDIVSLHAPYNKQTHHMINSRNVRDIKPGAYLVNTSRGGLIETSALLSALKSKRLAGAALDVMEEEGMISEDSGLIPGNLERDKLNTVLENHKLLSMDKVLVTPHNAFNSEEAVMRILTTTIENLRSWERGKPVNIVSGS